jgi:hypothetical protein
MSNIVLQNNTLRLELNPQNGALVGFSSADGRWQIMNRPHLGLSFYLLMPLPERRNNPVYGEKQPVSGVEMAPDGMGVRFTWNGVTSEFGGQHDVMVVMDIQLTERQAIYTMTLENRSDYIIESVYCPYVGDVQRPPESDWFKTFGYRYADAVEWNLFPTFDNLRGYFGVDYPTQLPDWNAASGTPMSPYILLRGEKQGLYVGAYSASTEFVTWFLELRPGYGSSIDARVPEQASISGKEVATRFTAAHMPYIQPGETRSLTPIALEIFEGGWQHGVDIYKRWRDTWMKRPHIPQWAREPHAWQQLHINSPEDELRIRFSDLPQIGEECARHGVKAIQLVGWNDGGQDQGNPSHDPDPRLGTFEELKEAIAKIKAMGVKLVLFAKFTWADRATDWFRNDLVRLAIKDPYGDYYQHSGYQYQTITQLLDINPKRLIPMCFNSEEYLRLCDAEFRKMVELGADGILFDECLHHMPTLLCFDTSHGHRYAMPTFANDRKLIDNFHAISDPVNPDFLFVGEACYDWEMDTYQLSYHRSESKTHIPLSRYMLPEGLFMTAITGFNDRSMVNQCLLYRYIISYEPYNFKGRLEDYPLTLEYGKQMDALRTELRDYFWDGDFRHEIGALVTANGSPHHPYAVFINQRNGKSGVVVANYHETDSIRVEITLDSGETLQRYRLVDDSQWRFTADGIVIPPQSAAAIIGEG